MHLTSALVITSTSFIRLGLGLRLCFPGWMPCASTPIDVISCFLLLDRKSITSPFEFRKASLKWRLQIDSSPFLSPGLGFVSILDSQKYLIGFVWIDF